MNFCRSVGPAGSPCPQPGDKDLRACGRGDVALLPLTPASHGRNLSLVLAVPWRAAMGRSHPVLLPLTFCFPINFLCGGCGVSEMGAQSQSQVVSLLTKQFTEVKGEN